MRGATGPSGSTATGRSGARWRAAGRSCGPPDLVQSGRPRLVPRGGPVPALLAGAADRLARPQVLGRMRVAAGVSCDARPCGQWAGSLGRDARRITESGTGPLHGARAGFPSERRRSRAFAVAAQLPEVTGREVAGRPIAHRKPSSEKARPSSRLLSTPQRTPSPRVVAVSGRRASACRPSSSDHCAERPPAKAVPGQILERGAACPGLDIVVVGQDAPDLVSRDGGIGIEVDQLRPAMDALGILDSLPQYGPTGSGMLE